MASTDMNLFSSRSHTVFTISIKVKRKSLDGFSQDLQAKLHVIDLAGS